MDDSVTEPDSMEYRHDDLLFTLSPVNILEACTDPYLMFDAHMCLMAT